MMLFLLSAGWRENFKAAQAQPKTACWRARLKNAVTCLQVLTEPRPQGSGCRMGFFGILLEQALYFPQVVVRQHIGPVDH